MCGGGGGARGGSIVVKRNGARTQSVGLTLRREQKGMGVRLGVEGGCIHRRFIIQRGHEHTRTGY